MKRDPYNDIKIVHKAALMNQRGGVSPACATTPRPINLRKATWTLRDQDVTCGKCLAALDVPDAEAEAKRRRAAQERAIIGT